MAFLQANLGMTLFFLSWPPTSLHPTSEGRFFKNMQSASSRLTHEEVGLYKQLPPLCSTPNSKYKHPVQGKKQDLCRKKCTILITKDCIESKAIHLYVKLRYCSNFWCLCLPTFMCLSAFWIPVLCSSLICPLWFVSVVALLKMGFKLLPWFKEEEG